MKLLFCLFVFYGCFNGGESTRRFEHHVRGSDFGHATDWELSSRGLVSHIVNLDTLPDVRVAENNKGEIIVNLRDTSITSGWQPGWFVIATNVRQRQESEVRKISILKKIKKVDIISGSKVKVHGVDVSAIDLMKEAKIHLNYPHTSGKQHLRHRRDATDILSKVTDKIKFHANTSNEVVSFNFNSRTGHSLRELSFYKHQGQQIQGGQSANIPPGVDFRFKCTDCFESRNMGQVMDLEIERNRTAPKLKKFVLHNVVTVTMNMDFEIEFKKALGVNERRVLHTVNNAQLRTIPVAVVNEKLPPIELNISYNKTVYLEINATANGPLKYHGKYHIQGDYVTTSNETSEHGPQSDVTSFGWRITDKSFTGHSSKPYNISLALYQEVTLQASVQWSQHHVSLVFTPPEVASILPVFSAHTAQDVYGRCETANLTVGGTFKYDKSDFVVKSSNKNIWHVLLRDSKTIDMLFASKTIANLCAASCVPPVAIHSSKTMESACGAAGNKIVRGDKDFNKLTIVHGDLILFRSEEGDNVWCGKPGRKCRKCVWSDNRVPESDECADRLMTSVAAAALTKLGDFVKEEWPNRKLVVLEAWDEPTSHNPHGSHGATSLHYTGRAVQVALTTDNPTKSLTLKLNTSMPVLTRLSELAMCSGFLFADVTSGYVQLCVSNVTTSGVKSKNGKVPAAWEIDEFQRTMDKLKSGTEPIICKSSQHQQGQHYPPGQNRDDVINPVLAELNMQYRLIQYPHDDTDFTGEGPPNSTCFQKTRRCRSTCDFSSSEEPWDWCQTRVMTPRMALRIRRLATIVNQKHKGVKINVAKPTLKDHTGTEHELEKNGRKLELSSTLRTTELRSLAVCAGFDYIESSNRSSIHVYVKLQDGYQTTVVPFQHTSLLAVRVDDEDVAYPSALENELRKTFLFDGFNDVIPLSEHFNISNFKHPEGRFFRLDPALVDCLEMVVSDMDEGFKMLSAYRNHSVNMQDIDHRHKEEKLRFETGQAVYLAPTSTDDSALIDLGQTILRTCTPVLRLQSRGLGIGCHSKKVYIDIRPMTSGDIQDIADVWHVENKPCYDSIHKSTEELKLGGPAIFPLNLKRTCKDPRLGHEYAYFSFNTHTLGFCFHDHESKFCKSTTEFRKNEADKLRDQLIKVAGTTLTRSDIEHDLHTCVLDPCGGCPGKGPVWDKKVEGCLHMLHTFLKKAKNPFKDVVDQAAFFNTDNADSSVHSLACHDEAKCVEDTQIYSLLMPLLNSKYKPNPDQSQEELLYSGHDNPSPLISLVEQEFAKQVAGVVKVYIESESDMSIMKDIIKVLMIYNREVTNVEFHLTEDVDQENVISSLQRKLEHWAGTTCLMWSRFAVAPYSVHVIPHHRKKRSLERSKGRNEVKRSIKEWELDWIKNM